VRPGVAIYVRVAENSPEQTDTDISDVGVRDYDVRLTARRHDLMLGAGKWAIVAQILKLADELFS
jgi:hypothetical protein